MARIEDIEKFNYKTIPIPDNATNGDVIKALFPNTKSRIGASSYTTCVEFEGIMKTYLVPTEWWNASYKENKDGNDD